tara:strand:- start:5000 stop:5464 length:465 start_codon:yes stop_codon:yes gene_type:complete
MNKKQYNSKLQSPILNFDAINPPTAKRELPTQFGHSRSPFRHTGGWGCRTMQNSGKKWVWCDNVLDPRKKRPKDFSRKHTKARSHSPAHRCPGKYPYYCSPNPKVSRGFGFCANNRNHCDLSSENMRIHDPYVPRKQCTTEGTGDFCAFKYSKK